MRFCLVRFTALPILLLVSSPLFAQTGMSEMEKQILMGTPDQNSESDESDKTLVDKNSPAEKSPIEEKAPPAKASRRSQEIGEAVAGPQRVPEDHILVVQRRYVVKENSHEITPLIIGIQPADSFRRQVQFGFSYAYHLTEELGIEALHVSYISNHETGLQDSIESSTRLRTKFGINPVLYLGSALLWTPFKSKAATRNNVYHFEGYFVGGGGVTVTETSNNGLGMFGFGFRSYLSRKALLKIEVRDYADFGDSVQHRISFLLGAGILL